MMQFCKNCKYNVRKSSVRKNNLVFQAHADFRPERRKTKSFPNVRKTLWQRAKGACGRQKRLSTAEICWQTEEKKNFFFRHTIGLRFSSWASLTTQSMVTLMESKRQNEWMNRQTQSKKKYQFPSASSSQRKQKNAPHEWWRFNDGCTCAWRSADTQQTFSIANNRKYTNIYSYIILQCWISAPFRWTRNLWRSEFVGNVWGKPNAEMHSLHSFLSCYGLMLQWWWPIRISWTKLFS